MAGLRRLAILMQRTGNDSRQMENFMKNLEKPTMSIQNSEQKRKSNYLQEERPATLLISSFRYFCQENLPLSLLELAQRIYFPTGIFQEPSSLWMLYRIVSE